MNRENIEFKRSQNKLKSEAPIHKMKKWWRSEFGITPIFARVRYAGDTYLNLLIGTEVAS